MSFVRRPPDSNKPESWEYIPPEAEIVEGKKYVGIVQEVHALLPKDSLVVQNHLEYPAFCQNTVLCGADTHIGREVLVIGGVRFFRRYNTPHGDTLMYCGKYGCWSSLSRENVKKLHTLVVSKDPHTITKSELAALFGVSF